MSQIHIHHREFTSHQKQHLQGTRSTQHHHFHIPTENMNPPHQICDARLHQVRRPHHSSVNFLARHQRSSHCSTTVKPRRRRKCSRHHEPVQSSSRHAKPGDECESETLILERESTLPRVRLLLDSQTGELVNIGQLVKVSSQLWLKLQKWLNKRGRIGNWTGIKLLIN